MLWGAWATCECVVTRGLLSWDSPDLRLLFQNHLSCSLSSIPVLGIDLMINLFRVSGEKAGWEGPRSMTLKGRGFL